jgi:putative SOS response-associated peptidase YedK
MCGRFIPLSLRQILAVLQSLGSDWSSLPDDFWSQDERDAYPGSGVQLIIPFEEDDQKLLRPEEKTWGYDVAFKNGPVFNTRIETASTSSLWRDSIENRRCLVPTLGFYEPHQSERIYNPSTRKSYVAQYEFKNADEPVTLLAGIWRDNRFSIVTTQPNGQMAPIHKRMPIVVEKDMVGVWLGPDYRVLADQSATDLDVIAPEQPKRPEQPSLF